MNILFFCIDNECCSLLNEDIVHYFALYWWTVMIIGSHFTGRSDSDEVRVGMVCILIEVSTMLLVMHAQPVKKIA